MKKPNLNTSRVLLIILGVLVAIIIGFNSKAIGTKSLGINKANQEMHSSKEVLKGFIQEISFEAVQLVRKIPNQHPK